MGYKILGFVVWRGAQWYVRRRVGSMVPSRRTAATAALVVGVVSVGAVVASRRGE